MPIADGITQLKQDFDDVKEAGKKAERDTFWSVFQKYGEPANYFRAFDQDRFNDENYNPQYDIACASGSTTATYIFYNSPNITDVKVPIRAENCTALDFSFYGCKALTTIPLLVVGENTSYHQNTFWNCTALVNLTMGGTIGKNGFKLLWSTLLTHDSLMSIINALKDYSEDTSGTEWVVTIGNDNIAKLTADELAVADAKGWQVV